MMFMTPSRALGLALLRTPHTSAMTEQKYAARDGLAVTRLMKGIPVFVNPTEPSPSRIPRV
ncbi:hypothetical protein ACX12M_15185 [Cellulosimicrobium cellulans]